MSHPEDEMERLLLRVVPRLVSEWAGAAQQDIESLERKESRPLPAFYLWFLSRMGASMGEATYARMDLSAKALLALAPLPNLDPRYFVISCPTEGADAYFAYDLEQRVREDAIVVTLDEEGGLYEESYDTFREMLATSCLRRFRVNPSPQRCEGWLEVDGTHVHPQLAPVMASMGFTTPIRVGTNCGLYERPDVTMLSKIRDPGAPLGIEYFSMGGASAGDLRQILGTIAMQSGVRVNVKKWEPPLPDGKP